MKNSKGFTVVEVIASLAVLAIAIGVTWPLYSAIRAKWAAEPSVEVVQPAARRVWYSPWAEPTPAQIKQATAAYLPQFIQGARLANPAAAERLEANQEKLEVLVTQYLAEYPRAVRVFLLDASQASEEELALAIHHGMAIGQRVLASDWMKN